MKLKKDERIIACVPENCRGPGWANQLIWVYVESQTGIRRESIQSSDMNAVMWALFNVLSHAHENMRHEVDLLWRRKGKK